jgi:LuxR family maltose regulon positive regulatory protein
MVPAVLLTKLFLPTTLSNLVSRPHLVKRLNEGLARGHKLTLVSAPAGFGKTTLVSEWVNACKLASRATDQDHNTESDVSNNQVAWFAIDEGDNDLARFLFYITTALNRLGGTNSVIGKQALGILQTPQSPSAEVILTSLINDIAAQPDRMILVLDDYHLIDNRKIDSALTYLLEHIPPSLHLVIATREDPLLHLARLRGRDHLTELRAGDLRFTSAESTEFLNQIMGLNLTADDIAALEVRTEGWIAGLQLAAISVQGQPDASTRIKAFSGSHRFVLDYLIEEVLEQQPANINDFLLHTSILDRMTGSLCDALTGDDDGQQTLETLEHANLFIIPLDTERQWYRYHHLFVDLLRQRQLQSRAQRVPTLYRKASKWFEQNGSINDAINCAIRGEDFNRAVDLIESVADSVWESGDDNALRVWLTLLPEEQLICRPVLCVFHAWFLMADGHLDQAESVLDSAETTLAANIESTPEAHKLQGRIATSRAFAAFYRGDIPNLIRYAQQALDSLSKDDLSWRSTATHLLGDAYGIGGDMQRSYHARLAAVEASKLTGNSFVSIVASIKLAIILRYQGRLHNVIEICEQQMQLARENGLAQTIAAGWLLTVWGEVLAEQGDLDAALDKATQGIAIIDRGGDLAMQAWSYLCYIRILYSLGDFVSAEEMTHKIEYADLDSDVPPWMVYINSGWRARIWLAQGNLQRAFQWAAERGLNSSNDLSYLHEMEYLAFARILIAQGKFDEARALLQRLLTATQSNGRISRTIEVLMLQALAAQAAGEGDRAVLSLEKALTLAEPGGFNRIFVDEGAAVSVLLKKVKAQGSSMKQYVARLLAAYGNQIDDNPLSLKPQRLVEPLSQRELEVLQLVAEGYSNREIGQRLFLALNTVKGHNRNIYGKLQVHRRTEAVARARELGLL